MAGLDTIKAIVEALRQKQDNSPHIVDYGSGPRRGVNMHGVAGVQKATQYGQYKNIQSKIGEDAISYEDWMKGQ